MGICDFSVEPKREVVDDVVICEEGFQFVIMQNTEEVAQIMDGCFEDFLN